MIDIISDHTSSQGCDRFDWHECILYRVFYIVSYYAYTVHFLNYRIAMFYQSSFLAATIINVSLVLSWAQTARTATRRWSSLEKTVKCRRLNLAVSVLLGQPQQHTIRGIRLHDTQQSGCNVSDNTNQTTYIAVIRLSSQRTRQTNLIIYTAALIYALETYGLSYTEWPENQSKSISLFNSGSTARVKSRQTWTRTISALVILYKPHN